MTPTATPVKSLDAATEHKRLLDVASNLEAEADELSRRAFDVRKRVFGHMDDRGLLQDRESLQHRRPDLYNPNGTPRSKSSEAGKLQAEIDAQPDLGDLDSRLAHARRLADRADEAVSAFVAQHYAELVESIRPEAEGVAGEVNAKAREFVAALHRYLEQYGKAVRLTEPVIGIDGRSVPGVDAAADFLRVAETVDLPAPVPEVSRD